MIRRTGGGEVVMRSALVFALIFAAAVALFGCRYIQKQSEEAHMITKEDVIAAQKAWGDGIVRIGRTLTEGGDYRAAAEKHIDDFYGYGMGEVLFKPTKAAEEQFRLSKQGALSYFVGGDNDFPEDKGFAINPWTAVRFENAATSIDGNTALAMGNYYFTTPDGDEVKVEYSFGYRKDDAGRLRIVLHHSSVPYRP